MAEKDIVDSLRRLAAKDKALSDVLHVLAKRQRARFIITVSALGDTMAKLRYSHPRLEYARVLEILGKHGVGTIERDKRGVALALKDIRVSLPSIGIAVLKPGRKVEEYQPRNKYVPIEAAPPMPAQQPGVVLTFYVNGKGINMPIPAGMAPEDIAALISRMQGNADREQD